MIAETSSAELLVMAKRHVSAPLATLVAAAYGCSTVTKSDLATRQDYLQPMAILADEDAGTALATLPDQPGERGGFITTLERGWLGVVAGKPDPDAMVPVARDLESRKTIRVTTEAKAYFYKESDEGYYPAEHEAVAFHVVNGFAFAMQGRYPEAAVEARRATFYLQNDFGESTGYDDPALRVWLGALWAALGDWEAARVDFRVVSAMGARFAWAKELAERETPPGQLALVLVGPGPDVAWNPEATGIDQIAFVPGATEPVGWKLDGELLTHGVPTIDWYARHQERDFAIRQVLQKSRYYVEGAGAAGVAGATMAVGTTSGIAIIALGIAGGGAIAYIGIRAAIAMNAGDVSGYLAAGSVMGGAVVAGLGIKAGVAVIDKSSTFSQEMLDKGFNPTNAYRYVRFLPDHVYLVTHDVAPATPSVLSVDGGRAVPALARLKAPNSGTSVDLFHAGGTEGAALAVAAAWRDHAHFREWAMLGKRMSYEEAKAACAALPGYWHLPTWTDALDAKASGMLDAERNRMFGRRLGPDVEFWSHSVDVEYESGCRSVALRDMSEGTVSDCAGARWWTLCVRTRSED
jgi:hypothetical protein